MAASDKNETRHEIEVAAPAELVYRLLADTGCWPWVLPASLHVEPLAGTDDRERVGMYTIGEDGTAHSWVALRSYDAANRTVSYRQETSWPPVADMGGSWTVRAVSEETSVIRSTHDFRAVDEDLATVDWIRKTLDGFATAELAAFREAAEREFAQPDLRLVLRDSAHVPGDAGDVYEFLHRADLWPDRLPHIRAARLTDNPDAGTQLLELDVESGANDVLTTRQARVGFPGRALVIKYLRLPPLGAVHHVRWSLELVDDGVLVTAEQTVVFDASGIAEILGADADLGAARDFATDELSANSVAVLDGAKRFAEARRSGAEGGQR